MDSSIPYSKELQLACLTVQRATLATKKLLEAVDKGSFDKSDSTPVTIADFAAQALIIAAIHHAFPDDVFVGEESASALRSDPALLERTWELVASTRLTDEESDAQLYTPKTKEEMLNIIDLGAQGTCGSQNRAWVLDPVDGTATFIQGQQYAVCLCLLENGRQKVGVLGCPNMNLEKGYIHEDLVDREGYGHQVFAVVGHGAYMRKMDTGALLPAHKLEPKAAITDPKDLVFVDCAGGSSDINVHARLASHLGAPWPPKTDLWATQLRYIAVAVGGCNASMKIPRKASYRSKIWDHAGGMLIVEEVGCIVSDLAGRPVDCSLGRTLAGCHGMIVAPSSIHRRFVDAVQQIM